MNTTKQGMRLALLLALVAVNAASCRNPAQKQHSRDAANDKNDIKFKDKTDERTASLLVDAVAADDQVILLSGLAAQQTTRSDVKDIAIRMKNVHTALLDRFKAYAVKRNISVPAEETKQAREEYVALAALPPQQFDKKWCELLLQKHRKMITDFETALNSQPEEDIKKLLQEVLPPLREQNDKLMQYHHRL